MTNQEIEDRRLLSDIDFRIKYHKFKDSNISNIQKETILELAIEKLSVQLKRTELIKKGLSYD